MKVTCNSLSSKELLEKTLEGIPEAIRREVQRRRDLGLPIHVARNGRVENIGSEAVAEPNRGA
jgi:hypothetical protein